MPEEKQRSLRVFLSYASQDRPTVRELSQRLVTEGWIDAWLDEKNLLPGQDWRLKIEEAVETSDIVIICLSRHSVTKEGYVQKELRYAREMALEKPEETIFLIPLRLEECNVPRGLRFYQWVDYFGANKDESYKALIESLKLRYEQKLKMEEAEPPRQEKEKQEREAIEKVAREKAEREAAEMAAREKAKREVAEKEAAEKAVREKEEKETAEKAIREKATREAAEKAKREKEKQKIAQKPEQPKVQTTSRSSSSQAIFWIIGIIGVGLFIALPSLNNNGTSLPPVPTQTRATQPNTSSTSTPSKTAAQADTPTKTPTKSIATAPSIEQQTQENVVPIGGGSGFLYYSTLDGLYRVNVENHVAEQIVFPGNELDGVEKISWVDENTFIFPDYQQVAYVTLNENVADVKYTRVFERGSSIYSLDWSNALEQIMVSWESGLYWLRSPDFTDRYLFRNPYITTCLSWSPDGRKISLNNNREYVEPYIEYLSSLAIQDVRTGSQIKILKDVGIGCIDWSPDGNWIAFSGANYFVYSGGICTSSLCYGDFSGDISQPPGIFLLDAKKYSNIQTVTSTDGKSPSWSPDGEWLTFNTKDGIYIIKKDGTEEQKILDLRGAEYPVWQP